MQRSDKKSDREEEPGERSEKACPVCGRHTLAVEEPPHIDVMGVQAYSDLLGMGDLSLAGPLGIVCQSCGTYWRSLAAFERGEAELPEPLPPEAGTPEAGPTQA